jgi:glycosyltransferase involved in cell wall biosynthesis
MKSVSIPGVESESPSNSEIRPDPKRLRVLHVNSGNLYGGVETLLVTLAQLRHLCEGMEPHFALCHEGRLNRELIATGVSVHQLGRVRISRPWTVWSARRRLRELLSRQRFDIVICHMPWSLGVFGSTVHEAGEKLGFWAHGVHTGRSWLERWARQTVPDFFVAPSRFSAASIQTLFRDLPGEVVYCPLALPDSSPANSSRMATRREQSVDDKTAVIIQVSRLEKGKGHMVHLEALSLLKSMDGWVCWMVGGPQRREEEQYLRHLQQEATRLGIADRVRFLGQRSDVPKLLAAADVFCQPNQAPESFGITFVEALWAGLPVITTAIGGGAEIIDDSSGLLVEPRNPTQLAHSLRSLIESPQLRARFACAGPQRARELCDPAAQMKQMSEFLQCATARKVDV